MCDSNALRHNSILAALLVVVLLVTSCAAPPEPTAAPATATLAMQIEAAERETPAPTPDQSGPKTLTLWHRWPESQAATVRALLDDYQNSRPDVIVEMAYQGDLYAAMETAKEAGNAPDIVALSGDRIAEFVGSDLIAPLDAYIDPIWLEDTYLSTALGALRLNGKLWGLPVDVQTVTFIYNQDVIRDEELSAQTSELLANARKYQSAHDGIWYLVYPARDDVYFAAPWFYGAGAWYAREDGSVGLNTPAGEAAAAFLSSLREIMPPDMDYTSADALFKAGRAAVIVNGFWYLPELEAAGIPYGLQIMPVVSSSGKPARPLVSVDGLMLGSSLRHVDAAVRVMAYLTNAESELQLTRKHDIVPANQMAIERAGDEGMTLITHFAHQAELGEPLPTTPYWMAAWVPVKSLLESLWEGVPAGVALQRAQKEAEENIAQLSDG